MKCEKSVKSFGIEVVRAFDSRWFERYHLFEFILVNGTRQRLLFGAKIIILAVAIGGAAAAPDIAPFGGVLSLGEKLRKWVCGSVTNRASV